MSFYWFQIRPAQIKRECSWIKRHLDAVPAQPGVSQEEINAKCNEIQGDPWYKERTCNLMPIPPKAEVPTKDWYGEATKSEYEFCIHSKGL